MSERFIMHKLAFTIDSIASDMLSLSVGGKAFPMDVYRKRLGVSKGTVKNAFDYLESMNAIKLSRHGHEGSLIEEIDYKMLQKCCIRQELLGIMPLPYSTRYEGLATASYEQLSSFNFNMAYARGAEGRIRLVENRTYHFAITSRYAALKSIEEGKMIKIAIDLGEGSYLSSHVLVFRKDQDGIEDGMRVSYDASSLDQKHITELLTAGYSVEYVPMKTQQTVKALLAHEIDAGVWNYDAISAHHLTDELSIVKIEQMDYTDDFTSAVIVIHKDDSALENLLTRYFPKEKILAIIEDVVEGRREAVY